MSTWLVVLITVAIIALSAFFVAVEFALLSAKRHRLEDAALGSRSARAALRSSSELTVLLAGSQLGITACTLILGAVTKPAVHHWLTPLFERIGLGHAPADAIGFVLALLIVTFIHLVVGEMMPKSWAIAHPETSAIALAVPMRMFMALTRPLLKALNATANWCLRRIGVEASDQIATGQDAQGLRHLVEHSANVGALELAHSARLAGALDLSTLTMADLVDEVPVATSVDEHATAGQARQRSRESGHLRLVVTSAGAPTGTLHIRDVLTAADQASIEASVRPLLIVPEATPVHEALARMRESGTQLVLVPTERGDDVVTITDVLARLFGTGQAGAAVLKQG